MRKYHVEITQTAERDIDDVFSYIQKDNLTAAQKWVVEIDRQIHSLRQFPLRGSLIPEVKNLGKEYRHLLYGNYRTIYAIKGAKVLILRVIHQARLLNPFVFEK